jgi:hypothetical protein
LRVHRFDVRGLPTKRLVLFSFGALGTAVVAAIVVALTWRRWVNAVDPEAAFETAAVAR